MRETKKRAAVNKLSAPTSSRSTCAFNSFKLLCLMVCLCLPGCSTEDSLEPSSRVTHSDSEIHSAVTIEITATRDDNSTIINLFTADAVLTLVFEIMSGQYYDDRYFSLPTLLTDLSPDTTEYILQLDQDYYVIEQYTCANSGTAYLGQRYENDGEFVDHQLNLVACNQRNVLYEGTADLLDMDFGEQRYDYHQLSITDSNSVHTVLTGNIERHVTEQPEPARWLRVEDLSLERRMIDGSVLNLSDASHELRHGTFCPKFANCTQFAAMSGSFALRLSQYGDSNFSITTPMPFLNGGSSQRQFLTGELAITADDGSGIVVQADNGAPDSFTVTLLTEGVTGESYEHLWTTFATQLTLP